jgi:hypothetical protein
MSPEDHAVREGTEAADRDDFTALNELIAQRNEAGDITYRWFRFRVRRGLGVFYALLSFVPVLGTVLGLFSVSQYVIITVVTIALVCVWIAARTLGLEGFGRMASTIKLLRSNEPANGSQSFKRAATFVAVAVSPWVAYAVAASLGQTLFQILFAVLWLVEFVSYRLFSIRRNKDPLADHRIEDWVVLLCFPAAALLSTFAAFPNASRFYGFLFVSPFLLFSGMKSLYDAPKELVVGLGSEHE